MFFLGGGWGGGIELLMTWLSLVWLGLAFPLFYALLCPPPPRTGRAPTASMMIESDRCPAWLCRGGSHIVEGWNKQT